MMSLFQIASQDQSIYYLSQIFGVVGDLLPSNSPTLLLGVMFKTFNTFILTVGAFVVIYTTVVGLLKTAQEGEFMGKQWNSLWVPLRTVFGVAALFPMSSGYCAIQIIFMWIIVQGIGAADVLWSTVVKFTAVVGNPTTTMSKPNPTNINTAMGQLFQALVCQANAKQSNGYVKVNTAAAAPSSSGTTSSETLIKYYCSNPDKSSSAFCAQDDRAMINPINNTDNRPSKNNPNTYYLGPNGSCGSLAYCSTATSDPLCKAQQDAIAGVVQVLGPIAKNFADMDYAILKLFDYSNYNYTGARADSVGVIAKGGTGQCPGNLSNCTYNLSYQLEDWLQTYCLIQNPPFTTNCCFVGSPADKPSGSCSINYSKPSSASDADVSKENNILFISGMKNFLGASKLDFINVATGQYTAAMMAAIVQSQAKAIEELSVKSGTLTDLQKNSISYGWIQAGSYFFDMANTNAKTLTDIGGYFNNGDNTYFRFSPHDPDLSNDNNDMYGYRQDYSVANDLILKIREQIQDTGEGATPSFGAGDSGSGAPAVFSPITDAVDSMSNTVLQNFMLSMGRDKDDRRIILARKDDKKDAGSLNLSNPMPKIASFGRQLMIDAKVLYAILLGSIFGITLLTTINPMIVGSGLTLNPIGEGFKAVMNFVTPFVFALIGALFSLGALLGIYVPLIPYIIYVSGAIGWFIACIEAMVAAPIVALGILSPGGQHDVLGKAEPAVGYMLGLFLRPVLMVVGLMAGSLLAGVSVSLINAGFLHVVQSIMSKPGFFELIIFISVYVSFVVTAISKSFSLIYTIPDRLLLWIGMNHAAPYGGEVANEALQGSKHGVEASASGISGAQKEAGGQVAHGAEKTRMAVATKKGEGEDAPHVKKGP